MSVNELERNPYRTPEPDQDVQVADSLSRTKFRRIISTIICTGAALWCLFPAAALLDRLLPGDPTRPYQPISISVLLLLALIGVAAFLLGLCIRHNQKRYIFSLFMAMVTMVFLFLLAL